ncbi:MAG TPA: hypothetical protein VHU44_00725 [Acidobacteriaceae bacterium]|nr:hypothetical protein [Acidobacteriaceae bacterium]
MRKTTRMATPLLAVALMSGVSFMALAQNNTLTGSKTETAATDAMNAQAAANPQSQQGYHDGMEAAKLDTLAKRKVDAKASHLYLHPPVKGKDADAYRSGFEAGYQAATRQSSAS